jgi:hypothetical protein
VEPAGGRGVRGRRCGPGRAARAHPPREPFHEHGGELEVAVTSPQIDFDGYATGGTSRDDVVRIMVGDLQRLIVCGRKGWSAPQDVPAEVVEAYERLVAAGYTRRLLREG